MGWRCLSVFYRLGLMEASRLACAIYRAEVDKSYPFFCSGLESIFYLRRQTLKNEPAVKLLFFDHLDLNITGIQLVCENPIGTDCNRSRFSIFTR